MTIFFILVTILQNFATALGVGSSTLAIVNFFVAIKDGVIDETERRMMGVVYIVLRVAMILILITTIIKASLVFGTSGLENLPAFAWTQLIVLLVLYVNAMLMTACLMPSTFGPALQAGSWYVLGILSSLMYLGLINFSLTHFVMAYVTWLILAVGIVNGVMAILKIKKDNNLCL